ncbi:ABC transporter ATP-binding protein/permease [Photorhabdus temperata]|uniref:ABC-type multidrug transport system, ATPase and permease component n=2 Tax=Photorhabdus temperata TaxID=574560 RepID=A0A081RZ74_PHOTE|nr:ABC transporter ATP-binding protein [Photorhabdus temperata]ERT11923.1 ABC transporter [Photorhabdus temperata J3]KER03977.1 ABC-type multidrug transport system, ATPase and permease component [Photorhabdus temperata subsp. temperata Meg1]MCT8347113.1 ABC transporter ATP-binding protein/permease [Photorhabdus temperata]
MTISSVSAKPKMLPALLGLVRKFAPVYFITMAVWTLIHGLPLLVGWLISKLLDRAINEPANPAVWWLLTFAIAAMVLRSLILLLGLNLDFTLIFKVSAHLKESILWGVSHGSHNQKRSFSQGDILNRIRDDSDEIAEFLSWTSDFLYRTLLLIIALAVLINTDIITTLALMPMVAGLWIGTILKRRVGDLQESKRQSQGDIAGKITDILTGIRDLRLSNKIAGQIERLSQKFVIRRAIQARHQVFTDLLSGLFRNIVIFGTSVVLLVVSKRIVDGSFTIGDLALFLTYIGWISEQIFFFGRAIANYKNADVCYERIRQLLTDKSEEKEYEQGEALHKLSVNHLAYSDAQIPVSFEATTNQIVGIVGEIGSGKTTFLRCLIGLEKSSSGSVLWNNREVLGNENWWRNPRIGYARQKAGFFGGTVRQNLSLGDTDINDEVMVQALEAVGLTPGSHELPEGLDTIINSGSAGQLSGGQCQRLALARMLCRPAEVYVVDNCDSSLDVDTTRRLWSTLPECWPGLWIVVSHNAYLLAKADHIVTIQRRRELV